MASIQCDICGKELKKMSTIDYTFNQYTLHVCPDCSKMIDQIRYAESKENAANYLQEQLQSGQASSLGQGYIQKLIKQFPVAETKANKAPSPAVQIPYEPSQAEFSKPVSATIVGALAVLCLIAGIILLLVGLFTSNNGHEVFIYAGLGSIITSAFMFIIMNISVDIHHLDHSLQTLAKENQNYQKQIIELLKKQQK